MLKRVLVILIVLTTPWQAIAQGLSVTDPYEFHLRSQQTYEPVMRAIQSGDLNLLREQMAPVLYAQYRTLFEENSTYAAYLRNYYQNSVFQITEIEPVNDGEVAQVIITWPSGETVSINLKTNNDKKLVTLF